MNIYTMKSDNFGDGINKLFWEKITKKRIRFNKLKPHYITTGSIMCLVNNKSIIFGTGFISENGDLGGKDFTSNKSIVYKKPLKVISVRGKLTQDKLLKIGINCPNNYGDPLILFPCIYNKLSIIKDKVVGIIPHYIDKNTELLEELKKSLQNEGYQVIILDIECGNNYIKFLDNINKCKYIISSSLHGIIMGLVYKKETIFLEFSNKVIGNQFKFLDFFSSLDIEYKYKKIYDSNILENKIEMDYKKLETLGEKMINLIPFIDENRKIELLEIYNNFYN